jgi:5-methylcytosine-specific restriction endonuclease McrA
VKLHVDHKIPWSVSRLTTMDNLTTLCEQCNLGKGDSVPGISEDGEN